MGVYTGLCSSEVLYIDMENIVELEDIDSEDSEDFLEEEIYEFVTGNEFKEVFDDRDLLLDAFALLGGNENLLRQLIPKPEESDYSSAEDAFIRLSTTPLWGEQLPSMSPINLGHLLEFMTPLHRERLPRILANALLYCSRYKDTKLYYSESFPNSQILLVSLSNFPMSDLPLGQTSTGLSCSRLAILYHLHSPDIQPLHSSALETEKKESPRGSRRGSLQLETMKIKRRVRNFSQSLALESKM